MDKENYKTICILGYVFSALGAIVLTALEFGWINTKPPQILYWAYLIGSGPKPLSRNGMTTNFILPIRSF